MYRLGWIPKIVINWVDHQCAYCITWQLAALQKLPAMVGAAMDT